jgi:hypothetical protein
VAEELLEAQAVEEPIAEEADEPLDEVRRLPEPASRGEISVWRGEVKTAALAAAGGLVAGAATVAAVKATRGSSSRRKPARRARRAVDRPLNVVASRSFLIDVHLLGK